MYKTLILMLQILKGFHSMARESLNSGVPNFDSELSLSKTKSARLLFGNNSLYTVHSHTNSILGNQEKIIFCEN